MTEIYIPQTMVYTFDGVECECSVTKDSNDEFIVQVIADTENASGENLKGRFIKLPSDHVFEK